MGGGKIMCMSPGSSDKRIPRRTFLTALGTFAAAPWSSLKADNAGIVLPQRGLCAHRGAMATHPENTIPAFQEAIRLGAHMIEFDVQLSRDGELVLMHDGTVDRTTNGKGKVTELTFKELRALDAGAQKDVRFTGTRIPTFEETLELMPRNVWLNCHLKGGAALGAAVAKAIVRAKRQQQAFMACGSEAAKAARGVEPGILICNMDRQANGLDYVKQTIAMKAAFIQLLGKGEIAAEHVQMLKAAGVRVNYYHAETAALVKNLFASGVDFPLVNDLAAFLPVAKEAGIQPWTPVF
jgi:glycerophosphoryl diester phosphodiesterase